MDFAHIFKTTYMIYFFISKVINYTYLEHQYVIFKSY